VFLHAMIAMLVAMSKNVATAPPWMVFAVLLLLHRGGMASEYVILALSLSVSAVTAVRSAARMKPASKLSEGMLAAYRERNLRIVSAAALSFSEFMVECDAWG
jgi:hypothetical protein